MWLERVSQEPLREVQGTHRSTAASLQPAQRCQSFVFPLSRFRAASALPPAASCDSSIPLLQLATCGLSVSRRSPCVRFKVPTGIPQPGQFCQSFELPLSRFRALVGLGSYLLVLPCRQGPTCFSARPSSRSGYASRFLQPSVCPAILSSR